MPALNARLAAVPKAGASIWLDQLCRSMTRSGALLDGIEEPREAVVSDRPIAIEAGLPAEA
jgi:hypothetical protein